MAIAPGSGVIKVYRAAGGSQAQDSHLQVMYARGHTGLSLTISPRGGGRKCRLHSRGLSAKMDPMPNGIVIILLDLQLPSGEITCIMIKVDVPTTGRRINCGDAM